VWKDYGFTGKGVLIANIDTGINRNHESLKDNFAAGGCFDAVNGKTEPYGDHGHGTNPMGTICGEKREELVLHLEQLGLHAKD